MILKVREDGPAITTTNGDVALLRQLLADHQWDEYDGIGCSSCWTMWPIVDQRDTAWDHTFEHHPDCPLRRVLPPEALVR